MTAQAHVVPLDPQVVEFLSQLSYLRGYKSALFDAKIRFQPGEKAEAQRWTAELDAANHLLVQTSHLMSNQSGLSLEDVESALLDQVPAISHSEGDKSPGSVRDGALRYMVERALGLIVEIRRTMPSAEEAVAA